MDTGEPKPALIDETVKRDLFPFWDKYGSNAKPVRLKLPDFKAENWTEQNEPNTVNGPTIEVPYFKLDSLTEQEQLDALKQLNKSSLQATYNIVIDVGSQTSLNPLAAADRHPKTIAIGLDNGYPPYNEYPNRYLDQRFDDDYPYVAKLISEMKFKQSAAFFFGLDATNPRLIDNLSGAASKVQIIAPEINSEFRYDDLIVYISKLANLIDQHGDLLIVGDWLFFKDKAKLSRIFNPETWGESKIKPILENLTNSFRSTNFYELSGTDLAKHFQIIDSGWIAGARPLVKQTPINSQQKYAVALLSSKK